MLEYNQWNEIKKGLSKKKKVISFKNRDIFWVHIGKNLGYETFGKGEEFLRPVLVFKKFSRNTFLGIPLTTATKDDMFHYKFYVKNNDKTNYASLSQLRIFDVSRLHDKLDKMSAEDFDMLKEKLGSLLGLVDTPLED
ncbi:MAG: type II toxin-antitoxin system PemK/MazF family toxin [Campylobacterota bacterium]|nr:type II toxin-antitoxin system PemK/MazF family toxin [Campylobacterota bacterium]